MPLKYLTDYKSESDVVPIGASVRLVSVRSLAREFGSTSAEALRMLGKLKIPLFRAGPTHQPYFNLASLELVLYVLLRPPSGGYHGTELDEVTKGILKNPTSSLWDEMKVIAKAYEDADRAILRRRLYALARQMKHLASWSDDTHGNRKVKTKNPELEAKRRARRNVAARTARGTARRVAYRSAYRGSEGDSSGSDA